MGTQFELLKSREVARTVLKQLVTGRAAKLIARKKIYRPALTGVTGFPSRGWNVPILPGSPNPLQHPIRTRPCSAG